MLADRFLHYLISGDNPAYMSTSGVETSGDMVEFLSCLGQKQFNIVCSDQEVATATIKCGIFDVLKMQVFMILRVFRRECSNTGT